MGVVSMNEVAIQKILSNQDKIFNQLTSMQEAITDVQDGQRALYVGHRNMELEIKSLKTELTFLKFAVRDDVIKKLNVLIDDNQSKMEKNNKMDSDLYNKFKEFKESVTLEAIEEFAIAKQDRK